MSGKPKSFAGYLVEFETPGAILDAAHEVRDAGFTRWDAHTPFPVHGLDQAMGLRATLLPWVVMIMGVTGCGTGLLLQWWTNAHNYQFMISGKPFWSIPASIPVTFELTILFSAIGAFLGMILLNGFPRWHHPVFLSLIRRRLSMKRFRLPFKAVVTACLLFCGEILLLADCFEAAPAPPWRGGHLDLARSASRPLAPEINGDLEICSQGGNFGFTSDSFAYLARGVNGDFEMTAELLSSDVGTAGILAHGDLSAAGGAHIRILAQQLAGGAVVLLSAYRSVDGAESVIDARQPTIAFPVLLRIRREGDVFTTEYSTDGTSFMSHMTLDASGSDLARASVEVAMVQASRNILETGAAVFADAAVLAAPVVDCMDTFTFAVEGGGEAWVEGDFLDTTETVTLAGIPATVLESGVNHLRVAIPAASAFDPRRPVLAGPLRVESAAGGADLENSVIYAGHEFIRGDANRDGRVNIADASAILEHVFRDGEEPWCVEAGDVNRDFFIDLSDAVTLLVATFLGGVTPPAPYPEPGINVDPSVLCGLPSPPVVTRLLRGDGSELEAGAALAAGEEVIVELDGAGLEPDGLRVSFGDVSTELLAGSTANALRVRIGEVATGGTKCPSLFETISESSGGTNHQQLFGIASGVRDADASSGSCPEFLETTVSALATSRFEVESDTLLLEFDPGSFGAADPVSVEATVHVALVYFASRGSRSIAFEYQQPGVDFDSWLSALAVRLSEELNAAGCDCEIEVEVRLADSSIGLRPCEAILPYSNGSERIRPAAAGVLYSLEPPAFSRSWIHVIRAEE